MFHSRFAALFCLLSAPLAVMGAEKRIAPVDAGQKQSFLREERVAVIVGVGAYPKQSGLNPLRYAGLDARELAGELEKARYKVNVLTDGTATRGIIRKALRDAKDLIDPNRGTLIFFFSGHGFDKGGTNYLATYESTLDDLDGSGLSIAEVQKLLKETGAARQMMWIDACRDNPSVGSKSVGLRSFAQLNKAEGLHVLYSTKIGRVSYENDELRHGVFTYFLLQGLRGAAVGADKMVTFRDLGDYVRDEVSAWGFKHGESQVPFEAGEASGDFLIASLDGILTRPPAVQEQPPVRPPVTPPPTREPAPSVTSHYGGTTSIEGDVIGADGRPLANTKCVVLDRLDIKGHYGPVKTDARGHYFHAGLPMGIYKISVIDGSGRVLGAVDNVRSRVGDPLPVNINLAAMSRQSAPPQGVSGQSTGGETTRAMTPEETAALQDQLQARKRQLDRNKELTDAYNIGMTALQARQYDQAIASLTRASQLDPSQVAVWSYLAEAHVALARTQSGAAKQAELAKSLVAYQRAIDLKPDDPATHNNYALALAQSMKFAEAQVELTKAAQLDPRKAGQYFYNLGAVLVNTGQGEPACDAFRKSIEADSNYAESHYQWANCLFSKALVGADGRVTPVQGTVEALQRYLQLAPTGPNAEGARGMLTALK